MFIPGSADARACVFLEVDWEEALKHSCFKKKKKTIKEVWIRNKKGFIFGASYIVTHPFGLRHVLTQATVGAWSLEPGALSLEPGAWSRTLIFLRAYLPSQDCASAEEHTLLLAPHISTRLTTYVIPGSRWSLSCLSVNPETSSGAFENFRKRCFCTMSRSHHKVPTKTC